MSLRLPYRPPEPKDISQFAQLLRTLKFTHGWPAMRAMDSTELLTLMERKASDVRTREVVQRFQPLLTAGLLPLLDTNETLRLQGANEIAAKVTITSDRVLALVRGIDESIGFSHRHGGVPVSIQTRSAPVPVSGSSYRVLLWIAGGGLVASALFAPIARMGSNRIIASNQKLAISQPATTTIGRVEQEPPPEPVQLSVDASASPAGMELVSTPPLAGTEQVPMDPASSALAWQACQGSDDPELSADKGPSSSRWTVIGPPESLEDVRQHCRSEAFVLPDGTVQVKSFADRGEAVAFAAELSAEPQHPHRFRVGEPTGD